MGIRKTKDLCRGCRNDFYNGEGAAECWSYKDAKAVRRWRLGWWVQPTTAGVFKRVDTLGCHNAPGKYAHFERIPDDLGGRKARKSTT